MRYPVDDFKTRWNITAGYGFGVKTDYGSHEAVDLNDNGAGDSDFGKPLYAIADGVVTSVHSHTTIPSFGKHLHLQIDGSWGTRYVHYAHCNEIFVTEGQQVKEGEKIATVGKSGTQFAHCHFALKKEPTGVDSVAKTLTDLNKWEDPIAFIEKWDTETNLQFELDKVRAERDRNWNYFVSVCEALGVTSNVDVAVGEIKKLVGLDDLIMDKEKKIADATTKIADLESKLKSLSEVNEALLLENANLKEEVEKQTDTIVKQKYGIDTMTEQIKDLKKSIQLPIFTGWKKAIVNFLAQI